VRKQSLTLLPQAFRFAASGLWLAISKQRNFRVHLIVASVAILLGLVLAVSAVEMAILVFAAVLGLVAEMVNTAIEEVVDLVSREYSKQAKVAKDVAAGMVLLTAMGTFLVGVIILLPPLMTAVFNF